MLPSTSIRCEFWNITALQIGAGAHTSTFLRVIGAQILLKTPLSTEIETLYKYVYVSHVNPSKTETIPLCLFAKHLLKGLDSKKRCHKGDVCHTAVSAWFKPKNRTKRSAVCPSENRGASMMVMSGLSQGLLANSCCLQQKTHQPARNIFSEVFCVAVSIRQRSCQQKLHFLSLFLAPADQFSVGISNQTQFPQQYTGKEKKCRMVETLLWLFDFENSLVTKCKVWLLCHKRISKLSLSMTFLVRGKKTLYKTKLKISLCSRSDRNVTPKSPTHTHFQYITFLGW